MNICSSWSWNPVKWLNHPCGFSIVLRAPRWGKVYIVITRNLTNLEIERKLNLPHWIGIWRLKAKSKAGRKALYYKEAKLVRQISYPLSIQLLKIYNGYILNDDWMDMNVQQNFNARLNCVQINDMWNIRIGKNILSNRLGILNNEINYDWLDLTLTGFQLKCKDLYLKNWDLFDWQTRIMTIIFFNNVNPILRWQLTNSNLIFEWCKFVTVTTEGWHINFYYQFYRSKLPNCVNPSSTSL